MSGCHSNLPIQGCVSNNKLISYSTSFNGFANEINVDFYLSDKIDNEIGRNLFLDELDKFVENFHSNMRENKINKIIE